MVVLVVDDGWWTMTIPSLFSVGGVCHLVSCERLHVLPPPHNVTPCHRFRMSLFEKNTAEGDLEKLHPADHNMNSEAHKHFPFGAFPCFPFLPGLPGGPTGPLSLNLTGQLEESSPHSASPHSEESPKSSPTGKKSDWQECLEEISFSIRSLSKRSICILVFD